MIQIGDLVRINHPLNQRRILAIVVGIDHKCAVCALRFLDTNDKVNYHISRLEKL